MSRENAGEARRFLTTKGVTLTVYPNLNRYNLMNGFYRRNLFSFKKQGSESGLAKMVVGCQSGGYIIFGHYDK